MRRAMALAGVSAVIAAGCGSGFTGGKTGRQAPHEGTLAQTAQATESAGAARLEFTVQLTGETLRGAGILDVKGNAYSMSMDLPGMGRAAVVLTGMKMYLHLPASARKGPLKRKPWAMIDLKRAARVRGLNVSQLGGSMDPSATLEQLRAVGQVKRIGTDTVRGVETTHFHAIVDLRNAMRLRLRGDPARMRASMQKLMQANGRPTVPVDVWVDAQNRLRRETGTVHTGPVTSATFRLDLFDFGMQRKVVAPPASQTLDLLAVIRSQQP